jgi:hypothetical protein
MLGDCGSIAKRICNCYSGDIEEEA